MSSQDIKQKHYVWIRDKDWNFRSGLPLFAYVWKLNFSPKLRHFVSKVTLGSLAVTKILQSREIDYYIQCSICGAKEKSINHVIFECPVALQTWVMSKIPSHPKFPPASVFSNIDYLSWRLPKYYDFSYLLWVMWYIWREIETTRFIRIKIEIHKRCYA